MKYLYFIISVFFIYSNTYSTDKLKYVTHERSDEDPSRRSFKNYPEQVIERLFEFEKQFYDGVTEPCEQIPLYSIINPANGHTDYTLGTFHDLPFKCIPSEFKDFMSSKVDEVYVESEMFLSCSTFVGSKSLINYFDNEELKKINIVFGSFFKIFGLQNSNVTVEMLYHIACISDCLAGMDSMIIATALSIRKPIYMLDKETDYVTSSLYLHRLMIAEDKSKSSLSDDELMKSYIIEEMEFCSTQNENSTDAKLIEKWSRSELDHEKAYESEAQDVNYKSHEVDDRNNRWYKILNTHSSQTKLTAVGLGHLPGLLAMYKRDGFTVERTTLK